MKSQGFFNEGSSSKKKKKEKLTTRTYKSFSLSTIEELMTDEDAISVFRVMNDRKIVDNQINHSNEMLVSKPSHV